MAPNYDHVRTNWVTSEVTTTDGSVMAECVFLTTSQIAAGALSVPCKRAEAIFMIPCAASDAPARVVVATGHIEDEDGGDEGDEGDDAKEGEGGNGCSVHDTCRASSTLIPIREPYSPAKVDGQMALPPDVMTPLIHTVRDDNKVVVWDPSSRNGYLVKMRKYASQPTQVFLNGLHPLFDGMKVSARCVLCFFPTGVLGHAQAVVGYAGGRDGLYARAASGVVHEWGASGVWKGNGGSGQEGPGDDETSGVEQGVSLVPLQSVLRVQAVGDLQREDDSWAIQNGEQRGLRRLEVAVVDARLGCFLRNESHGDRCDGCDGCDGSMVSMMSMASRVTVVDSCALPRKAYLEKRAAGGQSPLRDGSRAPHPKRTKKSVARVKRRLREAPAGENAPAVKDARNSPSTTTLSSERRAFGQVNAHRGAVADAGWAQTGKKNSTVIFKQRRNTRKATKPSVAL